MFLVHIPRARRAAPACGGGRPPGARGAAFPTAPDAEVALRDAIQRTSMADEKQDDARAHLEKALEAGLGHPTRCHVATAPWQVTKAGQQQASFRPAAVPSRMFMRSGGVSPSLGRWGAQAASGPAGASTAFVSCGPPGPKTALSSAHVGSSPRGSSRGRIHARDRAHLDQRIDRVKHPQGHVRTGRPALWIEGCGQIRSAPPVGRELPFPPR